MIDVKGEEKLNETPVVVKEPVDCPVCGQRCRSREKRYYVSCYGKCQACLYEDTMSVLKMKWKNKTAVEKVGEEYEHDKA